MGGNAPRPSLVFAVVVGEDPTNTESEFIDLFCLNYDEADFLMDYDFPIK